jgi:hypothetical protein
MGRNFASAYIILRAPVLSNLNDVDDEILDFQDYEEFDVGKLSWSIYVNTFNL